MASYYPFCIFKLFQANVSVTYRIKNILIFESMVVLPEIDGSVDIDSFVDIDSSVDIDSFVDIDVSGTT